MHTASKISVRTITMTALLSAIAYILAFAEFPVPLSPAFARMDLSDFPALIGAFASSPMPPVEVEKSCMDCRNCRQYRDGHCCCTQQLFYLTAAI